MQKIFEKIYFKIGWIFFREKIRPSLSSSIASSLTNRFAGADAWGDVELITVGSNVKFGGNVLLYCKASISIGDNTMIAAKAVIHTATHNYNLNPMWLERIDQPVKIGRDVWIGTGAIILPGIIIEDFAVIGAGSVVSKNVPLGAVVAGNPARILKYRNDLDNLKNSNPDTNYFLNEENLKIVKGNYNTKWLNNDFS